MDHLGFVEIIWILLALWSWMVVDQIKSNIDFLEDIVHCLCLHSCHWVYIDLTLLRNEIRACAQLLPLLP